MDQILELIPAIMAALVTLALFLNLNWRWNIIALSLQYVAVFWLVLSVWPTGLAAVKLVTGWMAGAIIASSIPDEKIDENNLLFSPKEEIRFRLVIWIIVVVIVWALLPNIALWLPIAKNLAFTGVLLVAMGLLQLSMTTQAYRIIFGLLTLFSGFEAMYASLEKSVLVAGLLALVTMGLAFIGAYIMNLQNESGQ